MPSRHNMRSCALCGLFAHVETMKLINTASKNPNLIMVAALSLLGTVEKAKVDTAVENLSKNGRCVCRSHVIQAAQYLCAEMIASGKRLSYNEGYKMGEGSAYFTNADIPPYLIEVINGMSNTVVITARDVWLFVNGALDKYHGTPEWPIYYEEEEGPVEVQLNSGTKESSSCFARVAKNEAASGDVSMAELKGSASTVSKKLQKGRKRRKNVAKKGDRIGSSH